MAPDLPAGWLSKDDERELRRLAAGKRVLELGAWMGRSTTVLSEVAAYVISVDRHRGIAEHESDSLPQYLDAVRELPNVAMVVANFEDFVGHVRGIDLVFIDGDHDFRSVERDIILAISTDPAVVAMHDYDFSDVRLAAQQFFDKPDRVGGSVASFKRGQQ